MSSFDSDVLKRLAGRNGAFSEARRSYLEKFANLVVLPSVKVDFQSLQNPAHCQDRDDHFLINIDDQTIESRRADQAIRSDELYSGPLSSVSNEYIDAFVQEGLLYHELGHVLFSDFDALTDVLGNHAMAGRRQLQQFINVFEDAVIELFLQQYYDCGTQLKVKNKLYHDLYHSSQKLWQDPELADPVSQATLPAFELGRYESGVLDYVDSEWIEVGKETFYEAIQTPDARERYEMLAETFKEIVQDSDHDAGQSSKELDEIQSGESDDSGRSDSQLKPAPDLSPPDDEEEDQESGGSSGDEAVDDEEGEEDGEGGGSGEDSDEEEEQEGGGAGGQEDGDGEDNSDSESLVGDLSKEDIEELESETEIEPDSDGSEDSDQIESELDVAGLGKGSGGHRGKIKEADINEFSADSARLQMAERRSRHLSRVVQDHFRPRMGDAERTGLTSGRFDSRQMIDAARGSPRVFKKEDQPDDPDFQVVVALDESGSMSGDYIGPASMAAGAIVKAFEDAGGKVYFYRFSDNIRLVKTPSVSYDDVREAVVSKNIVGGTVLRPLLEQYQEIVDHAENSFLFVISDGRPTSADSCKDELDQITDPKACLQLGSGGKGFEQNYDAFQVLNSSDDIQNKTESLIRRLVETKGSAL